MKKVYLLSAALFISLLSAATMAADTATTKAAVDVKAAGDTAPMAEGEVKKIDQDGGKVTIRHGEIKNLNMPGMTMVFRVKDAAMLDQLKAGDKIKFSADNINGKLTVTKVEVAK